MPEYLAPGVYVEEVDSGSKPIEGVSTSTAGMVGFTERGPENTPTFITSFAGFQRAFGGYIDHRRPGYSPNQHGLNVTTLPYAVEGFFLNGGQRVYITRVTSADARPASLQLFGVPSGSPASAELAALASEGDTQISLGSELSVDGANWLLIQDAERSEYVLPDMAGAQSGPVVLRAGLRFAHDDGRAVSRMEEATGAALPVDTNLAMAAGSSSLAVADAGLGDLTADQVVRVMNLDDRDQVEYVVIATDGARDIRGTLRFSYSVANVELRLVTLTVVAGDPARTLADPGPAAGATELQLSATTNIQRGDILSIEGNGAEETEFQVVDAVQFQLPVAVPLQVGLRWPHRAGVTVSERAPLLSLEASNRGEWGNRVRVTVSPASALRTSVRGAFAVGDPFITLASSLGIETGTRLRIARSAAPADPTMQVTHHLVQRVAGNDVFLDGGLQGADIADNDSVESLEFNVRVERIDETGRVVASEVEDYRDLSVAPSHARYLGNIIGRRDRQGGGSQLVRVVDDGAFDAATDEPLPAANERPLLESVVRETRNGVPLYLGRFLQDGRDAVDSITNETYFGADSLDPGSRTGLQSLKNVDEISIVAIPGITSQDVQDRLIAHCTEMRYRFAVLDSYDGATMEQVQGQRSLYDTRYAALYHPWAMIGDVFDPERRAVVAIPPSGHIVGLYARTDVERGVHKAPANEVLRNVRDLQIRLNKPEQDILNPRNINVIRDFRSMNRGIRVWGARTLTSDASWKYVNVRRLFIFVEKSIELGTQWVVFEPNDEPLWKRVNRSVTNFLTSVWRDGALQGTKPEEAFFVKVDRTTMTQDDVDNGRLIILVGIAPVKPAEFVIFRISQFTAESLG